MYLYSWKSLLSLTQVKKNVQVLMGLQTEINYQVFWDVTLCRLVSS